ncbi:hypothetical protein NC651_026473 [Populus alba x Populus x berolinensis]|nr:hypothetical protein NC651_026473 [Populus alba x Populus x berolinensis]
MGVIITCTKAFGAVPSYWKHSCLFKSTSILNPLIYLFKSTTWLKALTFAILTRSRLSGSTTGSLLTKMPHDSVPFLECHLARNPSNRDLAIPLVSTHVPYSCLPKTIISSSCKIIYICRDAKDAFVSLWSFHAKLHRLENVDPLPLEEAFELFCNGIANYGPYWDHVLGQGGARKNHTHDSSDSQSSRTRQEPPPTSIIRVSVDEPVSSDDEVNLNPCHYQPHINSPNTGGYFTLMIYHESNGETESLNFIHGSLAICLRTAQPSEMHYNSSLPNSLAPYEIGFMP